MALNSSGPISLGGSTVGQSINLELGQSATALASINASNFRTLAGVASGQISLSNFYGKSNTQPTFFASSSTVNASIYKTCFASSGNVYTFGYERTSNFLIVTKLNSTGTEQWTRNLGISPFSLAVGFNSMDIQEDSSGNVYVAGLSYLWKFDSAGTLQFNKSITPSNITGYSGTSYGVKFDSSCNLYVTVQYGAVIKASIAKFDTSGTALWSTNINSLSPAASSGSTTPIAPGIDSSGNVYCAIYGYGSPYYTYIVKLNSAGAVQTVKAVANMVPYNLVVTANGSVVINGNGLSTVANTIAYFDSSLALQWAYKSNSPFTYGFSSITLGPSNGIIGLTVASGPTGYGYQRAIVSFSSTGSINFSSFLSAPTSQTFDSITPVGDGASSLSFCSPGNVSYLQTQGQYYAMRIKNDGSQLYSYYINSPQSAGSILMGSVGITVTSTLASLTVSTATYSTAASTASSSSGGLTASSNALSLTTISLDSVTGGQAAFTVPGTYSWVCPAGVTSISAVAVGGGAGGGNNSYAPAGGGAGLGYINNRAVTAGNSYTVVVGAGGNGNTYSFGSDGQISTLTLPSITLIGGGGAGNGSGGTFTGDGGGNGGGSGFSQGGGGAGGYGGAGGTGGNANSNGSAGINGSAGGGYGPGSYVPTYAASYGGGGVSLLGRGNTGQGGNNTNNSYTGGSGGGSNPVNLIGGTFGGGGWSGSTSFSGPCCCATYNSGGPGRDGAVRIIWPGSTRTFPTTNTQTP